jgi:hypothetical protein
MYTLDNEQHLLHLLFKVIISSLRTVSLVSEEHLVELKVKDLSP